jgi:hypothetical protein
MKVAICMSGLTRTFKKCYQSYLDNIINLYDCDVFSVVNSDSNSKDIDLIKPTRKIIVENEPIHDEKDYIIYKAKRTNRYSIQGWLSQFWKIKICHQLMLDYQKEKSIKYDWVIRCRPDLQIIRKINDLNLLCKDYIYIPIYPVGVKLNREEFFKEDYFYNYTDNNGYLPDQFAIGSVDSMGVYAKRYDDLDAIVHTEKTKLLCSEYSLGRQLKMYNITIKFIRPLIGIQRDNKFIING